LPISRKFQQKLYETLNLDPSTLTKVERGVGQNFPLSPYLNIYGYPLELDYQDRVKLPEIFAQIDSFSRESAEQFRLPEGFVQPGEKLIYFSLGSMGCIDADLMNRIISMFRNTPHKYIVSMGPRADEIDLPQNCWGAPHLPQTAVLMEPLMNLVITHGGNNSFTESFTAGKPMIVMPLFADQYDNATRIQDKGYGLSIEPYTVTEAELSKAIDQLLNDSQLIAKMKSIGERICAANSKAKVCERIEQLAKK